MVLARASDRVKDTSAAAEAWRRVLELRATADADDTLRIEAQRALANRRGSPSGRRHGRRVARLDDDACTLDARVAIAWCGVPGPGSGPDRGTVALGRRRHVGGEGPREAGPGTPARRHLRRRHAGRYVGRCNGVMPLHPKVQALLTAQRLSGAPPLHTLTPERARADLRAQVPSGFGAMPRWPASTIARRRARRARCRCGSTRPPGGGPFPGIVYFHGGGFVIGDLETHDPLCRQIAARTGAVVCAVDYRLAPEHPFPAAADDALAAARWFMSHADDLGVDRDRLFVMGDSAGGTLATVTALALRDQPNPHLRGQILVYPITDHVDAGAASYAEFAEGYGLTRDGMRWFMRHYIADPADATDTRVCPVRMPTLRRLPPAFVVTAEYDVLRDEGERYAERLREDGVDVTFERAAGLHHGFIRLFGILEEPGAVDRSHRGVDASGVSAG